MKSKKILLIFILFCGLFGNTFGAQADSSVSSCYQFENSGPAFDNFEHVEYINGLLTLHFHLILGSGNSWTTNGLVLVKPDCSTQIFANSTPGIVIPDPVKNYSIRFNSKTHFDLWDDEHDAPINCNGCSVDIPQTFADGSLYSQIRFFGTFGSSSYFYSGSYTISQSDPPKEPILIIPGLLGTELDDSDSKVWPNVLQMATSPDDSFMDVLKFRDDLQPVNGDIKAVQTVSDINYVFGDFHYADLLVNDLQNQKYVLDQNLFLFPYDWRYGIGALKDRLQKEIDDIFQKTGAQKINIIAHSYGGMVLKAYLQAVSNPKFDHIVFVGVPNLGTADAVKVLMFGDDLGISLLSSDEIYRIAQNMPSVYELLPSREYFNQTTGFYDDLANLNNNTILNYDQSQALLKDLGKNSALLTMAESDHANDNFDFSTQPYSTYNIIGCGILTVKTISKMYNGVPSFIQRAIIGPKYRISVDSGDGTVVMQSAKHLVGAKNYFVSGVQHANLLSADSTREDIISLATTGAATNLNNSDAICSINGKILSLPSNLEITITDAATGKALVQGKDYNIAKTGADQHILLSTNANNKYLVKAKNTDPSVDRTNVSIADVGNQINNLKEYNNISIGNDDIQIKLQPNSDQVETVADDGTENVIAPSDDTSNNDSQNNPQPQDLTAGDLTAGVSSGSSNQINDLQAQDNQLSADDGTISSALDQPAQDDSIIAQDGSPVQDSPATQPQIVLNLPQSEPKIIVVPQTPAVPAQIIFPPPQLNQAQPVQLPPNSNNYKESNSDFNFNSNFLANLLVKLLKNITNLIFI